MQKKYLFRELTQKEFREAVIDPAQENFLQSVELGDVQMLRGWNVDYLGAVDTETNKIVAKASLKSQKQRLGMFFDVDGGPILDYSNQHLVYFFFFRLKKFVEMNGGLQLRISPNLTWNIHNDDGEVVEAMNQNFFSAMERVNASSKGMTPGFEGENPRWFYVKDLSEIAPEKLLKSFKKNQAQKIKRAKKNTIEIVELEKADLKKFEAVVNETSEAKGFNEKDLDFYEKVMDVFGSHAKFLGARINRTIYENELTVEAEKLQADIDKLVAKQNTRHQKEIENLQKQLANLAERLTFVKEVMSKEDEDEILLSVGLFFIYPNEIVYFSSGSKREYMTFHAAPLLQEWIMNYAIAHNIPRYNFYGIDGKFDGSDGVLKFKKEFKGVVEEKVGFLEIPIRPVQYLLNELARKAVHTIRS